MQLYHLLHKPENVQIMRFFLFCYTCNNLNKFTFFTCRLLTENHLWKHWLTALTFSWIWTTQLILIKSSIEWGNTCNKIWGYQLFQIIMILLCCNTFVRVGYWISFLFRFLMNLSFLQDVLVLSFKPTYGEHSNE